MAVGREERGFEQQVLDKNIKNIIEQLLKNLDASDLEKKTFNKNIEMCLGSILSKFQHLTQQFQPLFTKHIADKLNEERYNKLAVFLQTNLFHPVHYNVQQKTIDDFLGQVKPAGILSTSHIQKTLEAFSISVAQKENKSAEKKENIAETEKVLKPTPKARRLLRESRAFKNHEIATMIEELQKALTTPGGIVMSVVPLLAKYQSELIKAHGSQEALEKLLKNNPLEIQSTLTTVMLANKLSDDEYDRLKGFIENDLMVEACGVYPGIEKKFVELINPAKYKQSVEEKTLNETSTDEQSKSESPKPKLREWKIKTSFTPSYVSPKAFTREPSSESLYDELEKRNPSTLTP